MPEFWWSNIEIEAYLRDPRNAIANVPTFDDAAEVMATLGDQLRTDDEVEDSFLEALAFDATDYGADDMDDEEFSEIALNTPEIMDLCEIVEAVEKGHIFYG